METSSSTVIPSTHEIESPDIAKVSYVMSACDCGEEEALRLLKVSVQVSFWSVVSKSHQFPSNVTIMRWKQNFAMKLRHSMKFQLRL